MTYCLAMTLKEGLVFLSDSRTNAGVDQISTFSKMHRFGNEDRFFTLLSSGNLATTQGVIHAIERDIENAAAENLLSVVEFVDAAEYIGRVSTEEQAKHQSKRLDQEFVPEATFILGGQIRGAKPDLVQIYPEGNFIHAGETMPFMQIGETKYGKPILDRIIKQETSIPNALKCGLVSMDSTLRSSAVVGPPIESLVFHPNGFANQVHTVMQEDDPYLLELRQSWSDNILRAFEKLPEVPVVDPKPSSVTPFKKLFRVNDKISKN